MTKIKDKLKNAIYDSVENNFRVLPMIELLDKEGKSKLKELSEEELKQQSDTAKMSVTQAIQQRFPNALFMIFSKDDGIMGIYKDAVVNASIKKEDGDNKNLLEDLMNYKTRDKVINNFLLLVDGLIYNLTEPRKNKEKTYVKTKKNNGGNSSGNSGGNSCDKDIKE